ncbi:MAG: hypothetical protein PHT12_04805 [Patescibacteria group bacterium]|nr:hypothetical protein [Patescibacteria group bacterium]
MSDGCSEAYQHSCELRQAEARRHWACYAVAARLSPERLASASEQQLRTLTRTLKGYDDEGLFLGLARHSESALDRLFASACAVLPPYVTADGDPALFLQRLKAQIFETWARLIIAARGTEWQHEFHIRSPFTYMYLVTWSEWHQRCPLSFREEWKRQNIGADAAQYLLDVARTNGFSTTVVTEFLGQTPTDRVVFLALPNPAAG